MARVRVGKLPPRYTLLLNPHPDVRLSRCPVCSKPTHPRKFALLVHAAGWGPLALGKTCRYCTPCGLVGVHRNELEAELADALGRLAPAAVGGEYLVLGTVETRVWRRGLGGDGTPLGEALDHVADFRRVLELDVDPGGWRPAR